MNGKTRENAPFLVFLLLGVLQPELDLFPFLACGGTKFGLFSSLDVGWGKGTSASLLLQASLEHKNMYLKSLILSQSKHFKAAK